VNVGVLDYLNSYEFEVDGEKKHYIFNEIKIPGNMDIFATMNTSDQNVYTLDTAFTRRWSKERMPNDFNGNEIKDMLVPGMYKYTWEEFVGSVNKQIQDKLDDLQVNEDKQVGALFVKKSDLLPKDASSDDKEKAKSFAYKVLEYLWDDVSKLDHTVIFNPSYKTFESLVEAYLKNGVTVFNREIFKEKTEDSTLESSLEE
jgi:5-methylcytosine-specific restriction endonuclease McrBC GTP-binding regulatory subunit McrB